MEMPDSNRPHLEPSRGTLLRERAARVGKQALHEVLWRGLGRRNYARLGRFLWMQSRLDVANDPGHSGELAVLPAFAQSVARAERVVVCDVGANVGAWTDVVYAQLLEARSRIETKRAGGGALAGVELHVFEPSPTCYAKVQERLASWGQGVRVVTSRTAIADREGEATFTVFGETAGINTLMPMPGDAGRSEVTVQVSTLEAYAAAHGLDRIDFLKIDTEGNDFNVLEGARNLLREQRIGLVQFEYNHRWIAFRRYLKDAFDLLSAAGYHVGKITPKGIETYGDWHPELESFREGNYLAWPGSKLELDLPTLKWWFDEGRLP
jgi:FkbM family methyltransferase